MRGLSKPPEKRVPSTTTPDARREGLEKLRTEVDHVYWQSKAAVDAGQGGGKSVDTPPNSEPWSEQ